MRRLMFALVLVAACSREARFEGQVMDIWGKPIEGATVVMDSQTERPLTDGNGEFELPLVPGEHHVKAGRQGYVQEHLTVSVDEEGSVTVDGKPGRVQFRLYPQPEEAGFYVVGDSEYHRLEPVAVHQVGGELGTIRGVREIGEVNASSGKVQVVFHTPLKLDQVTRLEIALHELEHVNKIDMIGPEGPTPVPVNLYRSKRVIDTELKPMRSRFDYLLEADETLEPGWYAFDTQQLLSGDEIEAFKEIPEPLRVAYPIEVH